MFVVCEPIASGFEHVPVNSGLLRTIRVAFPGEKVRFCAEKSHAQLVRQQIGPDVAATVEWVDEDVPPRQAGFFARLGSDRRKLRKHLDSLNDESEDSVLVLASGNPSLIWMLKSLIARRHRGKRVQIFIHGDFSKLRYRGSLKYHLNPFHHIGTLRTAIRFGTRSDIQYFVLEESLFESIIAKYSFLRERFRVLDHPIPGDLEKVTTNCFSDPIRFGFLGGAYEAKGFTKYLEVASSISRQFPGKAEFDFIGFLLDGQTSEQHPGFEALIEKPNTTPVDRELFVSRLNQLHFVCLFYEKEYEFTASGILLDSVQWEKPIVASKLPLFSNLASRFGSIGYLCEPDGYQAAIAKVITDANEAMYLRQVDAMRAIKESRTPSSLAVRYRELVEQFS